MMVTRMIKVDQEAPVGVEKHTRRHLSPRVLIRRSKSLQSVSRHGLISVSDITSQDHPSYSLFPTQQHGHSYPPTPPSIQNTLLQALTGSQDVLPARDPVDSSSS